MNRRLEDEIAKMAFGDVDPKRTAELERLAQTDPEVRRALKQYRAMREGLQAMTPALDHQLSSERLREEILKRGLEPRRRGFDWRWATIPFAAAGAFALAAWWPSGSATGPRLVEGTKADTRVAIAAPQADPGDVRTPVSVPKPAVDAGATSVARVKPTQVASKRSGSARKPALEPAADSVREAVGDAGPAPAPGAAFAAEGSPGRPSGGAGGFGASLATMAAPEGAQPQPDPIVVIQPVRDANTGAYRATEVASPSNVLIGS